MEKLGLTVAEAAQVLGISRATLYAELRAGRGPALARIRGRVLISRSVLEAWFEGLSQPAGNAEPPHG